MLNSLRLLRSLCLARNAIPPVALATIARTLSCRRSLEFLDLSSTGARDAGAHALLPLLQSAGCPRELRLEDNAIGSAGATQLLNAAAACRGVHVLDLSNNTIDDSVRLAAVISALNVSGRDRLLPRYCLFVLLSRG